LVIVESKRLKGIEKLKGISTSRKISELAKSAVTIVHQKYKN